MEQNSTGARPGYWYDGEESVAGMLESVRVFRRADAEMRRRMSADMDMNVTDMQALQAVIAAERDGLLITPRELSARLRISSASTTKLLDRLTASGHLSRSPHPTDRRSVVLRSTAHAHNQVRERLTAMHERMAEIARAVPPEARPALTDFLLALAADLDQEGGPEALTSDPTAARC
jgi:DNA-binding MarR family transcriptional regulator